MQSHGFFPLWLLSSTCVAAQQPLPWAAGSKGNVCCKAQLREEAVGLSRSMACTILAGRVRPVGCKVSARGRESHMYILKADEFNLGWQCHSHLQPHVTTSASPILLPVLAQAFINQYSSTLLPVAGVNGKEWQEWGRWRVVFCQQLVVMLA